jgi:hypothetical protein
MNTSKPTAENSNPNETEGLNITGLPENRKENNEPVTLVVLIPILARLRIQELLALIGSAALFVSANGVHYGS